jgi:flagellar hook assembly protein FlgD
LPRDGWIEAGVYNVSGRLVAKITEGRYGAGYHEVAWSGDGSVEPGLYFVRVHLGSETATSRVVIIR